MERMLEEPKKLVSSLAESAMSKCKTPLKEREGTLSALNCIKMLQFIKRHCVSMMLPLSSSLNTANYPVMQILGLSVSVWINQCLLPVHDSIKNGTSRIES
ncbi:hypothetical protein EUGRSUZ_D00413 [Eucalyptus grandis]|uniref:Uncharacterized protein n=2 Tax=Eucalyptus grandis TaxID=71139 RepID=A0ACC3L2M6_EUCGR|nr:hypothetical protein EUGRSUZ_D00413 [Eucalyptus grandis]